MLKLFLSAVIALAVSSPALASRIAATPIPQDGQIVRFEKGVPTVEDDLADAAVRVMPLPDLDHGSMQFMIVVYNKSPMPVNIGVENISFSHNDAPVAVFTKNELEAKAKNRAMWSQIGYAMLAGAAAAAQNNKTYIRTNSHYSTPYGGFSGSSRTVISRPGLSDGQLASVAAGGAAIALSQIGLQKTLENLNDEILQTTTLDPETAYGGRIVVGKLKKVAKGDTITVAVDVAGSLHEFDFGIEKTK